MEGAGTGEARKRKSITSRAESLSMVNKVGSTMVKGSYGNRSLLFLQDLCFTLEEKFGQSVDTLIVTSDRAGPWPTTGSKKLTIYCKTLSASHTWLFNIMHSLISDRVL